MPSLQPHEAARDGKQVVGLAANLYVKEKANANEAVPSSIQQVDETGKSLCLHLGGKGPLRQLPS